MEFKESLVIRIGGEAGFGLAAAADIIAKVAVKLRYHVFSSKDYASQIKGGHNYHTVRIGKAPVLADVDKIDVLLALDEEALTRHASLVNKNGIILYDNRIEIGKFEVKKNILAIPTKKIETELNEKRIENTIFLSALIKCLGIELKILEDVLLEFFKEKEHQGERNVKVAQFSYKSIEKVEKIAFFETKKSPSTQDIRFWSGNEAVSIGALKAGLNFHVQYPMTPVSGILHYLALEAAKNKNLTVVQPEDEIAGINFALGASFAGARAMTATSGGGFALMVETLGLTSMAEVPLVVIMGQRPGPSTGVPTKTEQADLRFVLSAGTGDFPKVVLAPGDMKECYTETKRAFYLAEKYQLPVIILVDKHLAESFKTLNLTAEEKNLKIDFSQRWGIVEEKKLTEKDFLNGMFKRYAGEKTFLRTLPGTAKGMYTCAGDEHDETGEITEDPLLRVKMMERRMGKLELIKKELPPPELIGSEQADLLVVSWGSNKGAILEALEKLNAENEKRKQINFLSIKNMLPFQDEAIQKILENKKTQKIVLIEDNYSAQLGSLIREKTGIEIKDKILRYDGKTYTVDEIYSELKKRC